MKKDEILDSIEYVDSELINEADTFVPTKANNWLKWGTMVACLCLVIWGVIAIPKIAHQNTISNPGTNADHDEHISTLYTDRIVLPENSTDAEIDMIGCLVYKGSVYTQGASYHGDLSAVEHLVGDYLGEANGSLDEWSTQDEWSTEFASTYSGPVYSVKGYSKDFRLCIYSEGEKWLQFLDNFDEIGLSTGKDLFEDRFHIKGNVTEVTYLNHHTWSYDENYDDPKNCHYQNLGSITVDQFNEFIDVLCSSPFERIDYLEKPDFYNAEVQGHLHLQMKDGSYVELRLIDGGYVGCEELGWFFVFMPGDIFDTVLRACQ